MSRIGLPLPVAWHDVHPTRTGVLREKHVRSAHIGDVTWYCDGITTLSHAPRRSQQELAEGHHRAVGRHEVFLGSIDDRSHRERHGGILLLDAVEPRPV